MPESNDPLRQALLEATLAVLLGSTNVHLQNVDTNGTNSIYTVSIPSAFAERIRSKSFSGEFDDLIHQAMKKVDSASVAKAIEGLLAEEFLRGLRTDEHGWRGNSPNWLQQKSKEIAVEACIASLKDDEELLDILRTKIGAEVDRNRIAITVNLSNPEKP